MSDPKDRASTRLTDRLRKVKDTVEEFQGVYNRSLPVLTKDIEAVGDISRALGELHKLSQQIYSSSGAALGHLLEQDLSELLDSVQGVSALAANLDVFLQSNPALLAYVLQNINRGIIREAGKQLEDKALLKWIEELEIVLNERDEANRIKGDG